MYIYLQQQWTGEFFAARVNSPTAILIYGPVPRKALNYPPSIFAARMIPSRNLPINDRKYFRQIDSRKEAKTL